MRRITDKLESEIPAGDHCNPDTSPWPSLKDNCRYHTVGIFCTVLDTIVGNRKECGINEKNDCD
jgi:hypothetical protein